MEEEKLENKQIDNENAEGSDMKISEELVVEDSAEGTNAVVAEASKEKKTPRKMVKIFLIVTLVVMAWLVLVQYMAADKYDAMVQVKSEGSAIGVNPTGEKLDYGDIPKGNSMIRSITIENGGNMDVYIGIIKYGGIAELIDEEDNGFVLPGGEKKNIEFTLDIPISAEEKEYKGKVLIFKLPKIF